MALFLLAYLHGQYLVTVVPTSFALALIGCLAALVIRAFAPGLPV